MDLDLFNDIESKEIIKGFHGRFVHMAGFTFAYWEVDAGSEIPVHHHIHEQMMQVLEGEFEFTFNGNTRVYTKGMIVKIPSNVPHGGKALTACKLTDIFCPVREEYK
ncbi:MAG: cupin domain-containing protein [Winogradskyella sp.]|uniref:cupin domain-containing protein n=1 Tax=Winogradskyella sp. TaxID=1883156 RepID=UPI0025D93DC4|nr:cupin domain-containing protein [Winogradskyella sp.]NRB82494.1 cupin domain-containing protein [Winogradskyella sp.]